MLFVPCSRFRSTHPTDNEQLHPRRICSNGLSFGTRGFLSIPVSPDKWGAGRKTIGAFARVTYDRFDGIPCLEYCTHICPSRANYVLHKHILYGIHVALFGLELIWNCEFRAPTTKRINACFVCKDQSLKASDEVGYFQNGSKDTIFSRNMQESKFENRNLCLRTYFLCFHARYQTTIYPNAPMNKEVRSEVYLSLSRQVGNKSGIQSGAAP